MSSDSYAFRLHLIKYCNLVVFESPAPPLRESTGTREDPSIRQSLALYLSNSPSSRRNLKQTQ
jgi:hypothetical protein